MAPVRHLSYVFPITATVRDADGLTARMRMTAEAVEPIEFMKAAQP